MKNVRRFFRYDLDMAFCVMSSEDFQILDTQRQAAFDTHFFAQLQHHETKVEELLLALHETSPHSYALFFALNHRLQFWSWMCKHFMLGENPMLLGDFAARLKADREAKRPTFSKESQVAPLILGLYERIDQSIKELLKVIRISSRSRLFLFSPTPRAEFDDKAFLSNLQQMADKAILPAQILCALITQLNFQNQGLNQLKVIYQPYADFQAWPLRKINLSAGGLSYFAEKALAKFTPVDCFLLMDETPLWVVGKTLNRGRVLEHRSEVVVNFELASEHQQSKIHRFIQQKEIADAMQWMQANQA